MSWYRIKQIAELYPAFTQNAIRNRVANALENGLWPAVKRSNTSILIHGGRFGRWIEDEDCLIEELIKTNQFHQRMEIFKRDLQRSRDIYNGKKN